MAGSGYAVGGSATGGGSGTLAVEAWWVNDGDGGARS